MSSLLRIADVEFNVIRSIDGKKINFPFAGRLSECFHKDFILIAFAKNSAVKI
jgi:hypothetical protein